jgi:hypothetical protein
LLKLPLSSKEIFFTDFFLLFLNFFDKELSFISFGFLSVLFLLMGHFDLDELFLEIGFVFFELFFLWVDLFKDKFFFS